MTAKELFLSMESYEEFDRRRSELKGLKMDKETLEHAKKIFPTVSGTKEELYSFLPDGRMVLGGKGDAKKKNTEL